MFKVFKSKTVQGAIFGSIITGVFALIIAFVVKQNLVINNNLGVPKPQRNYVKDFPPELKDILNENKDRMILIFSDSKSKDFKSTEAGEYAGSILEGLQGDKFKNIEIWPDSKDGFAFAYRPIQSQRNYPGFLVALKDFESVKDKKPIKEVGGVKIVEINKERIILWIGEAL